MHEVIANDSEISITETGELMRGCELKPLGNGTANVWNWPL